MMSQNMADRLLINCNKINIDTLMLIETNKYEFITATFEFLTQKIQRHEHLIEISSILAEVNWIEVKPYHRN